MSTDDAPVAMPDSIVITQTGFDPLGPQVRTTAVASGRTINFIDEGDAAWPVTLFFGGAGTTVRAFGLLEFTRSMREQLGIRMISVERNGLGQTPFDPTVGLTQYAEDVWSLLDQLSVDQPAIVAISGGGPYAANVAATRTDRVRSMHLACALSEFADPPAIPVDVVASDPVAWWRFPPNSPTHVIPGFVDTTIEEATRGVFARGRDQPPHGLSQAFEFYRDTPLPDLSALQIPAFLYWGTEDKALSLQHLERWRAALPNVQATRLYVGEGHDIQYRHWDQILTDIAHLGQRIVICFEGRTVLVPPDRAPTLMAAGATLGLCAWH